MLPGFRCAPPGLRNKERKKISEAKRRQTQGRVLPRLAGAAAAPTLTLPRLRGGNGRGQHIYRRSTAVLAPRSLSSQGTQPQAMLPGTRPLCMTGFPRPCLSQSSDCTSRPSRNARGLMPKAARERVAKPRAGTALAPAIRLCLPNRSDSLGEIRSYL